MIRSLLIAFALVSGTGAAVAQQSRPAEHRAPAPRTYSDAELWRRSGDRVTFTLAHISLPQRLGVVGLRETGGLDQGRGLDNTAQFRSDDNAILASVYIYYPPIAHAGLTAFMTDRALDTLSSGSLRRLSSGTVPVGGVANGAIRMGYGGYHGNLASSAAFIKAGRWMVKLRVSGPENRRADVEATMDALLSALRFEGDARPRAAALLDVQACPAPSDRTAQAVTDPAAAFGTALLLPFDPLGEPGARGRDGQPLHIRSRIGDGWCLSTVARYGREQTPILRATGAPPVPDADGNIGSARSVGLAMVSDSGTILEVLSYSGHYTLIYHRIGESFLLGSYATPPSDEQLVNLLSGADNDARRVRVRVSLQPEGGSEITLTELPGTSGQQP